MKYLLPSLILLLVSIPFGWIPFTTIATVISILTFLGERDWRFLFAIPLSLLSYLWLPLSLVSILLFLILSNEEPFVKLSAFLGALLLVFIIFPIAYLFFLSPPTEVSGEMLKVLATSVVASSLATLVGLSLSLPLGYYLARRDFPGKSLVEGIIDLPIVIPHTVAGIILLLVFGTSGIIGAPLESIGIRFYYALPGIVVAMLFVSVPFIINQVRDGIEKVDERYELVAMNLGASRGYAFLTVVLPQIKRNILSGVINSWARAMSEFGAVIMIAFYPMIAPTYIYFLFTNYGLKATLPATSFLLLVTLGIFVLLRSIFGRLGNAGD